MKFNGFKKDVIKFFVDLEQNNNKEWFAENKIFYENEVKQKSLDLVEDMNDLFFSNNLPYVSDKKKSLFRIYRDIRFSKDKSPYKTNLGIFFPFSTEHIDVKDPQSIGLYLHIDANEIFVAGGLHMPDSAGLLSIRTRIMEEWEIFKSIIENEEFKTEFPVMNFSNSSKTTPKGFPKGLDCEQWIKLKDFTPFVYLKENDILNENLKAILIKKAKAIYAFNLFLKNALENF